MLDCLLALRSGKPQVAAEELPQYVNTIVMRRFINACRDNERREAREMEHVCDLADGSHAWMSPEVALEEAEMEDLIASTLAALPPMCRRVFEMVRSDDLSYHAVASALGIPRSAVSNHVVLAQRRFREALLRHGVTPPPGASGRAKAVNARAHDLVGPKPDASEQRVDSAA